MLYGNHPPLEKAVEMFNEMVFCGGKVWGIWWMRESFIAYLHQFFHGKMCDVGPSVVVE